MDLQHQVSRSDVHGETYPKPKLEPESPFPTDGSSLTSLPLKSPTRTSTSSSEHDLTSPIPSSVPSSQMQTAPELQMPGQGVSMPVDHMAYSQPCPPLPRTSAHTEPSPPTDPATSVAQGLAGTDRTMLAPIHLPSASETGAHSDSVALSSTHPLAESITPQPTCASSVGVSVSPHHTSSVDSMDDSQPTVSADLSPVRGSESNSTKSASIKLAWEAALAMSSACKEEQEHLPQCSSDTDMEECSEEQAEPGTDHTGMVRGVWRVADAQGYTQSACISAGFITFLHPHESSVLGIKVYLVYVLQVVHYFLVLCRSVAIASTRVPLIKLSRSTIFRYMYMSCT